MNAIAAKKQGGGTPSRRLLFCPLRPSPFAFSHVFRLRPHRPPPRRNSPARRALLPERPAGNRRLRIRSAEAGTRRAGEGAPELAGAQDKIGDDRAEGFSKARHHAPMLSLDNAYDEAEFRAFVARLAGLLRKNLKNSSSSPRSTASPYPSPTNAAGSSAPSRAATARRATTSRATSRSSGGLRRAHPEADAPELVELRGEIYMTNAEFARINAARAKDGDPPYANPRNLAAGTVKLLDPREAEGRALEIALYGLGACDDGFFERLSDFRTWLGRHGLPVPGFFERPEGADAAWNAVTKLERLRHDLPFPTDGAVVKLDRIAAHAGLPARRANSRTGRSPANSLRTARPRACARSLSRSDAPAP